MAIIRKVPWINPPSRFQLNRSHWLAKDLRNWWHLDGSDSSGGNWVDYAHTPTPDFQADQNYSVVRASGNAIRARDSNVGWYGECTASPEWTETNSKDDLYQSPFTLGFWCKYSSSESGAAFCFRWGSNTALTCVVYPYDTYTGNGARVYWETTSSPIDFIKSDDKYTTFDEWHHYVFTSRSFTDHELYIDGRSVDSSTRSEYLNFGTTESIEIAHVLGGQNFGGYLSNITLHKRGMSSAEVAQWYQPANRWGLYAPQTQTMPTPLVVAGGYTIYNNYYRQLLAGNV